MEKQYASIKNRMRGETLCKLVWGERDSNARLLVEKACPTTGRLLKRRSQAPKSICWMAEVAVVKHNVPSSALAECASKT